LARGGADLRFTFGPRFNGKPIWSPEGSRIAFSTNRSGGGEVIARATNGVTKDEVLDTGGVVVSGEDWSSDGQFVIEERDNDPKTRDDIWVLPQFGDRRPFAYLNSKFNEKYAKLSPNGRWLAYQSDESTRFEIYVESFPMPGAKRKISTNGGSRPVWSRDGKELYFISADQKMMAVQGKEGAQFEASVPEALFDVHVGAGAWFDVAKDGHFLIPVQVEQPVTAPITVVLNWQAGLKK
jgi:Tol biopolymer transport system component